MTKKTEHRLHIFRFGEFWYWRCDCGASDENQYRTETAARREARRLHSISETREAGEQR